MILSNVLEKNLDGYPAIEPVTSQSETYISINGSR